MNKNKFDIESVDLKITEELFRDHKVIEVSKVYEDLGGQQAKVPFLHKTFYFIEPKTIIVLDDYLHFNRYRAVALRSGLYEQLAFFPLDNYRRYCRNFEKECIKSGLKNGIWSNKESNYHFGDASEPGDFFKNGSSGWKLQAFKDYLEDAAALLYNYKLVRFSVYDNFLAEGKLIRLDSVLDRASHPLHNQLLGYITRRLKE
ncbi:MAG: hypothetical protein M3512_03980 [Bacteroidota bacterium]|nr:hypothetical protein [Bacteroidota bacterium]